MDHNKVRMHLSALKDGELNENLRDPIVRHLQSCDSCREELNEFERIDSTLRGLPEISVSKTFVSEILARTQAAKPTRHWKSIVVRRIADRFFLLAASVSEVFLGYGPQTTGSLDEFGDFPPYSLGHVYFSLISR
ncbi:MAG: zf-HC2 domain-containing protein [Syntrophobacteraceae bacterium]|nr:zf-HC2 domain-containing protein [Syntrophobacteraceae bacterium]